MIRIFMGNLFDCRGSRIGCNAFEIVHGGYSGSDGFLLAEEGSAGKPSRHCLPFIVDSGYSFAVKGIPGTIQEGEGAFATTHWSVVAACTDDSETADAALSRLFRDYWPPLYTFARRRGYSPADAQDLVQGFFAYLLQNKAYAYTDRRKGKFRSFLLASFKNYMTDAWERARAFKRGGNNELVLLDDEIEAAEALIGANRL
jgi:hypothetical protein